MVTGWLARIEYRCAFDAVRKFSYPEIRSQRKAALRRGKILPVFIAADTDAVLSLPVSPKRLQAVPRRNPQVVKVDGSFHLV
jgi:hypothetical protein